jgi:DNA primase
MTTTRVERVLEALHVKIGARRGRRVWAYCPFHDDEQPKSFFVRIEGDRAGQNHCFSCKKGGSLRQLVMHVRGCDEETAREFIRLLGHGFEPPKAHAYVAEPPAKLGRTRFTLPREIIFEPLTSWVTLARRYATDRCKITAEEVTLYGLGYAVDGRLGGRIVIPWRGLAGVVGGYSARTFCDAEPKYQTPDMDDNADRAIMFGEHLWPEVRARKTSTLVVTEGALNAMAVRRAVDGAHVCAIGGSEIDPLQMIKIATFARVVLLTDPDLAGDVAAASIASTLGRHAECTRVRLPPKKDALDVGPVHLRDRLLRIITDEA